MGYVIGLMGMWLLCDAIVSISMYLGRYGQSWTKDHSIRVVRGLVAIALMVIGAMI